MIVDVQPKNKKNVETDLMGDKMGRIHLGKQNLKDLQTRKMKGLKRGRAGDEETEDVDIISDDEGESTGGVMLKRPKLAEV